MKLKYFFTFLHQFAHCSSEKRSPLTKSSPVSSTCATIQSGQVEETGAGPGAGAGVGAGAPAKNKSKVSLNIFLYFSTIPRCPRYGHGHCLSNETKK